MATTMFRFLFGPYTALFSRISTYKCKLIYRCLMNRYYLCEIVRISLDVCVFV